MEEPENESNVDSEGQISENEVELENLEHHRESSPESESNSEPEIGEQRQV